MEVSRSTYLKYICTVCMLFHAVDLIPFFQLGSQNSKTKKWGLIPDSFIGQTGTEEGIFIAGPVICAETEQLYESLDMLNDKIPEPLYAA